MGSGVLVCGGSGGSEAWGGDEYINCVEVGRSVCDRRVPCIFFPVSSPMWGSGIDTVETRISSIFIFGFLLRACHPKTRLEVNAFLKF